MKDPTLESEQQLLKKYPAVHSKKRHILQKVAKIFSIVSLFIAFISAGYLLTLTDENDKAIKAGVGAIAFFCFTVGFVLHAIATTSLPNLRVSSKKKAK